jgi:hypothetical protein
MMEEVVHAAPAERLTLGEAGNRYIRHLEGLGRKRSTIEGYHTILAVHLSDFGQAPVQRIGRAEVEAFVGKQRQRRQSAKSIRNQLGLLHSIFGYAEKRGWARGNPVKLVDKPAAGGGDPDIRFLELEEVERLAEEAPADALGRTEPPLSPKPPQTRGFRRSRRGAYDRRGTTGVPKQRLRVASQARWERR